MSRITSFNRSNLQELRAKLDQVLGEVGSEFGVAISVGSMSFSPLETTTRLTMTAIGDNAQNGEIPADAKARIEFENYAKMFDLKPDDFGKEFVSRYDTFVVSGIKPRSSKYPVLATNKVTGKVFKFTAESVAAKLAA
jgi:hypothetical protein